MDAGLFAQKWKQLRSRIEFAAFALALISTSCRLNADSKNPWQSAEATSSLATTQLRPSVSYTNAVASPTRLTSQAISGTCTAVAGATVTSVRICTKSTATCGTYSAAPSDYAATATCVAGSYSYAASLTQGLWDIEVVAIDDQGLDSALAGQGARNYVVDTTAPTFAGWISPPAPMNIAMNWHTFHWNPANDTGGSGIASSNTYFVEAFSNGSCAGAPGASVFSTTPEYLMNGMALGGSYSLRVTAFDAAGNSSTPSCSAAISVVNEASDWYGGVPAYTAWTTVNEPASSADGNGGISSATAVEVDPGRDYLYVLSLNQINRYVLSTGAFAGWIGKIASSPTGGDPGCAGAAVDSYTPGWCVGGTSKRGWGAGDGFNVNGYYGSGGLAFDAAQNYLYVADSGNTEILKLNAANGATLGWHGAVNAIPTGGVAGCAATPQYAVSPGWCTGGSVDLTQHTGDGGFNNPFGITLDAGGDLLYVADGNHRISKFVASTGQFLGWIGKIATSPTGGAGGCAGASAGSATPGWCTGGTAGQGSGDGMFWGPDAVAVDPAHDLLFVADGGNGRISKFVASTGQFIGWNGWVQTTPTGGDPGCATATPDSYTPGWCTGGTGYGPYWVWGFGGLVSGRHGMRVDGTYIYVSDNGGYNNGIKKFNEATGAYIGWAGAFAQGTPGQPTGGTAGCTTLAQGQVAPGWCQGGDDGFVYSVNGSLNVPVDLALDPAGDAIYVVELYGSRVSKFVASTGAAVAWLGDKVIPKAGWSGAGAATSPGSSDGLSHRPTAVVVDTVRNVLYELDQLNYRINKRNATTGAFIGWIGEIGIPPTGGDSGCAGAATGSFTPGWCTGGRSRQATVNSGGLGFWASAGALAYDSANDYLYVMNDGQVLRYVGASGAFTGWIGEIGITPTGGDPGCNTAAGGTFTPGWCIGGGNQAGAGDGGFAYGTGVAVDPAHNSLYVVGWGNSINKYVASTGAFVGWLGKVGTTPTAGAAGCAGLAVGSVTPGWCKGGAPAAGSAGGMLDTAIGIFVDSAKDYLYVADSANHRISRYRASTGSYQGWIGVIGSTPTGGDTGCAGAATGVFTPGWCLGGAAQPMYGDLSIGALNSSMALTVDTVNDYLYVFDGNHVKKYVASKGTYAGWVGRVAPTPTGGFTGCASAAVDTLVPGWCTGGSPGSWSTWSAYQSGALGSNSWGIVLGGGYLYVADPDYNRVQRFSPP